MTVDYPEKQLFPISFSAPDSLSGFDHRVNTPAPKLQVDANKLSYWQFIFLQSRVNNCFYNVDDLPKANWQWPKDTWFQERLVYQLKDSLDHLLLA